LSQILEADEDHIAVCLDELAAGLVRRPRQDGTRLDLLGVVAWRFGRLDQQTQCDGHSLQRSCHPDSQDLVLDSLLFPQHRVCGAAAEDHEGAVLGEVAVFRRQMGVPVAFEGIEACAPVTIDAQQRVDITFHTADVAG